jgi:ketosteroid isomerase-like protein
MKELRVLALRALFITAATIGVAQAAPTDTVRAAVEAANAEFSAATAKGDAAGIAALYAAGGQVLPPGAEPVKGAPAIQKFWQGALDSGVANVTLKTLEVYAQGATATEVGQFELQDKAGKSIDHGKYIVVWHREGGKWTLLRDMFSSSVAAAKK